MSLCCCVVSALNAGSPPRGTLGSPHRTFLFLGPSLALSVAACLLTPRSALGFERQWHVGAGVGWVVPTESYRAGGAVGLHGAYGISDVFDARFQVQSSVHEAREGAQDSTSLTLLGLGIAYKIDIIEWVPYLGVRAGYYRFGAGPLLPYARDGALIGSMLGIDYAFSRHIATGLEVDFDTLLPEGGVFGAMLRAEYRWGW